MKKNILIYIVTAFLLASCQLGQLQEEAKDYPVNPVLFNDVQLSDKFWLPKIEVNRTATIPVSFEKCEEMGRMDNFLIAGGVMEGSTKGEMPFDDTDLYKIIEGASYSLSTIYDSELDSYLDSIINIISIGQEDDGYLTTWKTIDPTVSPASWCPPGERWENLSCSHELYNAGHLFEAAAAHFRATGKRNLLDIAIKNADLLLKVFGPGEDKNPEVPGHQIVETGLIKLYLLTNKQEYLNLAKHFLDQRGDDTKREVWGPYNQDHLPVVKQDEAVGHAVRAVYMYAGMTDIAALFNDSEYLNAIDKIWDNVVTKKIYITGGVGSRHDGEAFGENYELPDLTAYNETCAAIANVYWNHRMFLLYGDSKYIDVLERSLYNGVISGVGIDGKTFFYPNPLECDLQYRFNNGSFTRKPWFDCSCCPTNMCRFMPSIPGYIYAYNDDKIYVNLFAESNTKIDMEEIPVVIEQKTNYPWDGAISLTVDPASSTIFTLMLRLPGWAEDQPLPGDLYYYSKDPQTEVTLFINGEPITFEKEKGYIKLTREWQKGDIIEYNLPMTVKAVKANNKVDSKKGLVAFERGPVVYSFEGADNQNMKQLAYSNATTIDTFVHNEFPEGVIALNLYDDMNSFIAIPYYLWNNRGANLMKVWIPDADYVE